MLKDPMWRGPCPYDALGVAGITPQSSMREVRDASFDLMAKGKMSPEVRRAWDVLRIAERRQEVDFLLYPVDLDVEVAAARVALEAALEQWGETPDLLPLIGFDEADLAGIEEDFRAFDSEPIAVKFPSSCGHFEPLPEDDFVEFDR